MYSPRYKYLIYPSNASACCSLQTQALPDLITNLPLILASAFSPHFCRFDISRTFVIGFCQHAHDGDQDFLHTLNGRPPLGGMLVMVRIITGRMKNGYADSSVGIDC